MIFPGPLLLNITFGTPNLPPDVGLPITTSSSIKSSSASSIRTLRDHHSSTSPSPNESSSQSSTITFIGPPNTSQSPTESRGSPALTIISAHASTSTSLSSVRSTSASLFPISGTSFISPVSSTTSSISTIGPPDPPRSGTSFIIINSIFSITTFTSPTVSLDPTQSPGTSGIPLGPIIGGVIGGMIVVALSILVAFMIIKRRRRRKQDAPIPTANPLLDGPRARELAFSPGLSTKRPSTNFNRNNVTSTSDSQNLTLNQSTSERSSSEPMILPSRRDFELAMQRQMDMMGLMSQRITALEVHQRGHNDTAAEPPDYESQESM